jgi:hypothetical protein
MSIDNLISNFDYLTQVFGIQAFNEHGERILTDDEIIKLILPYYFEVDPICQYAICISLAGTRNALKFCDKIYELKGE